VAVVFVGNAQQNERITLISPKALKTAIAKKGEIVLIDVRTPKEYAAGSIEGAQNINFFDENFKAQFAEFDKKEPIYIFCKSGNRSGKASKKLAEMGFEKIYDLQGG